MRATKSSTSASARALSSDSIGTACRTLAKRPEGCAPTFCDGESLVTRSGNLGRVFLIVTFVVALDFQRQPFQLDLGLRLGEPFDVGESFCLCCLGHGLCIRRSLFGEKRPRPGRSPDAAQRASGALLIRDRKS